MGVIHTYGPDRGVRNLEASALGLDSAIGLDVGVTSEVWSARGWNQLALMFEYTHNAATDIRFNFERARDPTGPWKTLPTFRPAAGIVDMQALVYRQAVSADVNGSLDVPINANWMRLTITGTSAHATNDIITCEIELSTLGTL